MKQKKSCSNCLKGTCIGVNSDILCRVKGVVSPDYVCFGHRNKPEQKSIKEMNYKCSDCEYFELDNQFNDETAFGLCSLFSVRHYDGKARKACSKFIKNTSRVLEVS